MPKMTIYVPDALKADMDKVEEQGPNWSGIAQESFALEVTRLTNLKRSKGKMEAVIERLRDSKQKLENRDRVRGHEAGRRWAMDSADYDSLRRIAAFGFPDEDTYVGFWSSISSCFTRTPDDFEDLTREFWETWSGEGTPSNDFVRGFKAGATEVWNEVADKL